MAWRIYNNDTLTTKGNIMEQLILNYGEYAGVAVAFVVFFDRLAKLTPTESDNKIVSYAYKVFAVLGLKVQDRK
jgi:hypothetical protein